MRSRIYDLAVVIALAAGTAACRSSQTSVTGPTATDKCQMTATSTPQSFTAAGGPGSINIATSRDCTWSVATNSSWVTLGGDRIGQGEAAVPYMVAANTVPTARSGSIVVGTQTVAVNQAAAQCTYLLGRAGDTVGFSGGTLSVNVTTLNGCTWSASSNVGWISITSGQGGSASGTIGMNVAANSAAARVGQVNVAGQIYTVNQSAAPAPEPAPPAPTPPSPTPTPPAPSPTPGPPTPAPQPPPAPTPKPTPPPAGGQKVEFDGTVNGLSGQCPNVTFTTRGNTVVADGSTDYRKSSCGDLRNGRNVSIKGVTQSNGTVHADRIDVDDENGEEDQ